MPQSTETMLADIAGAAVNMSPGGDELPNKASRRRIDFNEASNMRLQWADSTGGGSTALRIEYSLDDGATWAILIPDVPGVTGPYDNDRSDWTPVPPEVSNEPYNVLVRALVSGAGGGTTRVTYVTLSLR